MVTLRESFRSIVLSRVTVWGKRLMGRNGHAQLPGNVEAYLQKEFGLPVEEMVNLRCVKRQGNFAGAPAEFIRLFDPARARAKGIAISGYHDLDRNPELVLFEGHTFKGKEGTLYLRKTK